MANVRTNLTLLLLLFSISIFSQNEKVAFKLFSFEDGLSHRNAFKIQQDQEGYIWIATINGLNKYDGIKFTHFSNLSKENKIPQNYISELLITPDTNIWMAGENYLITLDGNTYESKIIRASKESALFKKTRTLSGLTKDSDGNIWTVTYNNESESFYLQKTDSNDELQDVLKLEGKFSSRGMLWYDGHLYFASKENEILKIEAEGKVKGQYNFGEKPNKENWIIQMQATSDGTIWALLNDGRLFYLEKGETQFLIHPIIKSALGETIANCFLVEESGDIWIGGAGNLHYYDKTSDRLFDYSESIKDLTKHYYNIRDLFQDEMGVIWAASDYGVIKVSNAERLFNNYLSERSEFCRNGFCSMRGITEDEEGNMYFSYYNSIHVLPKGESATRPLFPRNDYYNPPFGLTYFENALWTGNGNRIDLETQKVDTIFNYSDIDEGVCMVGKDGKLWFAVGKWILIYDTSNKTLTKFEDKNSMIDSSKLNATYLYQGKTGDYLWLSTVDDGIYKIDLAVGAVEHYTANENSKTKLLHNRVLATYEDNKGNLWIATANGINKLDIKTEKIWSYTTDDGLPNNFINGMLSEGDTAFWFSTDVGLTRLSTATERFISFTVQDGLSANEFNRSSFFQAKDGRMYFGGLHGVNAFYPNQNLLKEKNNREANLIFTSFSKLDGRQDAIHTIKKGLNKKSEINLSHNDKFFTFNYSLANYSKPSENRYSYKLEGYDREWSEPSSNSVARFTSIPAGKYLFKVRASSNKHSWNKDELAIKINIQQAYYKTKWFLVLSSLLGAFFLWGAYRYRTYTLRERERKLATEVKSRTKELEREKKKSDDLLLNILPAGTAEELKKYGKAQAKRYPEVTVFFSDFKNFTKITQNLEPEQLVAEIDRCFKFFDRVMEKYGLEKIKTIGDAYMCAGGIPVEDLDSPKKVVHAALEIQEFLETYAQKARDIGQPFFEARIGIHTGPVIGGIVGIKKFAFDIWGETVNTAARMEQSSEVGKVNISESTYQLVKDEFNCEHRGKVIVKHIGEIDMYFVEGRI